MANLIASLIHEGDIIDIASRMSTVLDAAGIPTKPSFFVGQEQNSGLPQSTEGLQGVQLDLQFGTKNVRAFLFLALNHGRQVHRLLGQYKVQFNFRDSPEHMEHTCRELFAGDEPRVLTGAVFEDEDTAVQFMESLSTTDPDLGFVHEGGMKHLLFRSRPIWVAGSDSDFLQRYFMHRSGAFDLFSDWMKSDWDHVRQWMIENNHLSQVGNAFHFSADFEAVFRAYLEANKKPVTMTADEALVKLQKGPRIPALLEQVEALKEKGGKWHVGELGKLLQQITNEKDDLISVPGTTPDANSIGYGIWQYVWLEEDGIWDWIEAMDDDEEFGHIVPPSEAMAKIREGDQSTCDEWFARFIAVDADHDAEAPVALELAGWMGFQIQQAAQAIIKRRSVDAAKLSEKYPALNLDWKAEHGDYIPHGWKP